MKKKVCYLFGVTLTVSIFALYGISSALAEENKENPKDKKSWTSFFKGKFDTSKKTTSEKKEDSKDKKDLLDFFSGKQEPSKNATVKNTDQGGGGGGGGSVAGSVTSVPIGGGALRPSVNQGELINAVQIPRPQAGAPAGGETANPIVRIERPVTVNTNAPAGPPRPERPSANLRPNEDRGVGR